MIALVPWGRGDLALLRRLNGDPATMTFLGGPESARQIADRQRRYERPGSRQHRVVAGGQDAGWVGYWEREWEGEPVLECGWAILPALQGRGLATAAVLELVTLARAEERHRTLHAFPKVEHAASNAIARKAGFTLRGEAAFEYPPGTPIRVHDWALELRP